MDWLREPCSVFARSMAMGIVDEPAMGRKEKREGEGGEAREGRPRGEARRREGVSQTFEQCTVQNCADCAVYLTLSEDGRPCPALPKMPSDTYRKPYVGRGAQVHIPIPPSG
jgi:hypothetical protein